MNSEPENKQSLTKSFLPGGQGGAGSCIIIAGGGTGGHIFPAIAIANAIKKMEPDTEFLFVGAKGKMEMEKVPLAGYKIEGIDIAGYNRSSLIKNIGLPFKLLNSFWQVWNILGKFKPHAVIGVGGYSSFPVLRLAQFKGIPSFIHESNSFAGKSNILLGKKATRVFVASDGMEKFFPPNKIEITGNPVRQSIAASTVNRTQALQYFSLNPDKKTVFITGGSLGAKGINEAIAAGIEEFEKNNLQVIWQTGVPFEATAIKAAGKVKNAWCKAFLNQIEYAYAAADVVVSRAGAMAIAELCVMRKATVFVPYPHAAEDHQTVNAQNLVNKNAGLMVKDSEAKEKLVRTVIELTNDENRMAALRTNIGKLAVTNADEQIAKRVLELIHKK